MRQPSPSLGLNGLHSKIICHFWHSGAYCPLRGVEASALGNPDFGASRQKQPCCAPFGIVCYCPRQRFALASPGASHLAGANTFLAASRQGRASRGAPHFVRYRTGAFGTWLHWQINAASRHSRASRGLFALRAKDRRRKASLAQLRCAPFWR